MALDIHITLPENSPRWNAVIQLAEDERISPQEAAERVFDDGVRAHACGADSGHVWGAFTEDADSLDEIVADAMSRRRNRFDQVADA